MTTEVQTVEAGEAPAVPAAATPATCSADYAANAAPRRLKRAGAPTGPEAADLKRPRTAPATPIDLSANAGNPPAGKLTASDLDSRMGGPNDNHPQHLATRPSATASAPAALNRALRTQSTLSTSTPSTGPGSGSASGAFAPPLSRHCSAISGVVTAPQRHSAEDNPNLGLSLSLAVDPHQHSQLLHPQPATPAPGAGAASTGGGVAATAAANGGENSAPHGGAAAATRSIHGAATAATAAAAQLHPRTPYPGPSPHHSYSYGGGSGSEATPPSTQALQLQQHPHPHAHPHHRHDKLEEQVFSPAFHLPASASASAASSAQPSPVAPPFQAPQPHPHPHQPGAARQPAPPLPGDEAGAVVETAAVLAAAAGAAAAGVVAVRSTHPHGPGCTQLHAIDLNVVDGVAVDDDKQQEEEEGGAAAARGGRRCIGPAAAAEGCAARPQKRAFEEAGGEVAGGGGEEGGIEAMGEELSSEGAVGPGAEGGAEVEVEGGDGPVADEASEEEEEEEEEEDFYECDNDENAPMAAAVVAARGFAVTWTRTAPMRQWPLPAPQQQQQDAVLVASAPRGLAAAVSAALPTAAAAAAAAIVVHQAVQQVGQQAPPDEEDEEEEDDGLMEFDPFLFIKQLPPLESCVPAHRSALLPLQARSMARRKTLVLDLDETLVHSSLEAVERSDFSFPVVFNGTEHQVYVRQRPHLRNFMIRVSSLFEVVVFTASQRIYAERLLDILDPEQQLVRHRIYRDSCVVVDGNYLKDLSVLGRDLAHTVIVDNSPQAFGFQVDNGIPIESWYDDDEDSELIRLLPFLESLAGAEVADVRPRIRSQFRLRELIDRA